ncbi:MAG: NAD-dependent epimerase/dehydratase family protein [Psychrobacillus psychrotolerans]|uniref:NAD-dependent epimerase/dehydratase family protein n=1 Tax=Psychrobacillus psychrotolerans TaxID=126156 RepID=UPI003BB0977B
MTNQTKLLITGATGFTGIHACRHFQQAGYEVIGVSRKPFTLEGSQMQFEPCDLTNKNEIMDLIQKHNPDRVLHLAGQNHVPSSWTNPIASLEVNTMSTAYLLEAIRHEIPECRVVVVGSTLQFDINDITTLEHPYSLSKTLQALVARSWQLLYEMDIVIANPSNLIGPGKSNGVCSILAKKVAEMELLGSEKVLKINNLLAQRDFLDVRDAVSGYEIIFNKSQSGSMHNITSGLPRYLKEITSSLQAISSVEFTVESIEDKLEEKEIMHSSNLIVENMSSFIPFDKSMEDILNYQRKSLV